MSNPFDNDDFKALQKEWYDRLARDGKFQDIEKTVGTAQVLIQRSSNSFRQAPEIVRQTKERYYDLLIRNVNIHKFEKEIDRTIMTLLSEGTKIKEIVIRLMQTNQARDRKTIRYIIRKYEFEWQIKHWLPNQLDPNWKTKK
jgi:hypothetical protein